MLFYERIALLSTIESKLQKVRLFLPALQFIVDSSQQQGYGGGP